MRLYVIGPVSGIEGNNRPAFEVMRQELRAALGCEVEIPHDTVPENATWGEAMKLSIRAMMACDGVAVLPGWQKSRGALIERKLAQDLCIPTLPSAQWLLK